MSKGACPSSCYYTPKLQEASDIVHGCTSDNVGGVNPTGIVATNGTTDVVVVSIACRENAREAGSGSATGTASTGVILCVVHVAGVVTLAPGCPKSLVHWRSDNSVLEDDPIMRSEGVNQKLDTSIEKPTLTSRMLHYMKKMIKRALNKGTRRDARRHGRPR